MSKKKEHYFYTAALIILDLVPVIELSARFPEDCGCLVLSKKSKLSGVISWPA